MIESFLLYEVKVAINYIFLILLTSNNVLSITNVIFFPIQIFVIHTLVN